MCNHLMENYQGDLADILGPTVDGGITAAAPPSGQSLRNTLFEQADQDFGHPFSFVRDPLMQNIDAAPLSDLFHGGGGVGVNRVHGVVDDEMKRPASIFSRMLQISPTQNLPPSPCDSQAPPRRGVVGSPSPYAKLLYNNSYSGLHISSPRNTGVKRRKSQAKKVVCIPAATPANSKSSGEIVPSDLWAWRKYGQKPIKGSPYPRGYYRCSSSKGCCARKQVERSRTDPNMLVITYTSDHNHPWPTQRNALAGSTRSKNNNNVPRNSSQAEKPVTTKQERKEASSVKEETDQELKIQFLDEGFKPTLADSSSNHHGFFADLGEFGDDALDLFQHGFPRDDHNDDLDSFSFYDWGNNGMTAAISGEDSNRNS